MLQGLCWLNSDAERVEWRFVGPHQRTWLDCLLKCNLCTLALSLCAYTSWTIWNWAYQIIKGIGVQYRWTWISCKSSFISVFLGETNILYWLITWIVRYFKPLFVIIYMIMAYSLRKPQIQNLCKMWIIHEINKKKGCEFHYDLAYVLQRFIQLDAFRYESIITENSCHMPRKTGGGKSFFW